MTVASPAILALDCSAASCSAALWQGGALAAHRFETMARGQAEALMPLVESVMQDAGTRYVALDLVAATVGPGSFTGLRIGLAAARGIALAASVPAMGVTSFAAVAASVSPELRAGRDLAVAIDDRRGGVYWQDFADGDRPGGGPGAFGPDRIAALLAGRPAQMTILVVGDGAPVVERALQGRTGLPPVTFGDARPPDAAHVARLAAGLAGQGLSRLAAERPPVPLYLRAAEARLPTAR